MKPHVWVIEQLDDGGTWRCCDAVVFYYKHGAIRKLSILEKDAPDHTFRIAKYERVQQ